MKKLISETTLLEGNIAKQLTCLAVPLLFGNILQQLYHTIDSLIIGRFLGADAFAAAGVAGAVMNLFIFALSGFCTGLSVLFASLYGAGDEAKFRCEVFVSFCCGGLLTVALSLFFLSGMPPLLRLIQTPEGLVALVSSYLTVIIAGMPAVFFYNLFSRILRAVGNTKAALCFLALSVVLNAVLDYAFVAVWALGMSGAAMATVLSQLLSAFCCLVCLMHQYPQLIFRRADMVVSRELLKCWLRFGFSFAIQESSLYIGKILVQGAVNTLGTAGIAAYTAATRIEGYANSFGDSGGLAESVFISQNRGAGKRERARKGAQEGLKLHLILGVLVSVLLFLSARPGVRLFLNLEELRQLESGVSYLKIISGFYILNFIGSSLVGCLRGTGCLNAPVIATILNIGTRVAVSYLLIGKFGLPAIAMATGCGWTVIVIYLIFAVRKLHTKNNENIQVNLENLINIED